MILTHDPTTRICIQIGLGRSAEYIYLAHPQWRKRLSKQKPIKQIPDALCAPNDNRRWHYYGIDAALTSILFCTARYSLLPRAEKKYVSWICTAITNSQEFYTSDYLGFKNYLSPHTPKGARGRQPLCFILRAPFDWIDQKLAVKEIDVLATDIEGFENDLFSNYSWAIRPKFIAIEYHDELNHVTGIPIGVDFAAREKVMGNELAELIQAQGYQLIHREPTNYKSKNMPRRWNYNFYEMTYVITKVWAIPVYFSSSFQVFSYFY